MKKLIVWLFILTCVCVGATVFAASGTNIGTVAANVTSTLSNIAKFITALAYILGLILVIISLFKLKAHKEAPTQIPISTAIVFMVCGCLLIFLPTGLKMMGTTLYASGAQIAGVSGITNFGASKAGS